MPAEGAELTVSPLIIDIALAPGESTRQSVTVAASGSAPLDVAFEHADFGFADDAYELRLIEDSAPETVPFSTRGWFGVPHVTYHIPAGGSIVVPLRIAVPKNATPGTHLGAAFFRTISKVPEGGAAQVLTAARSGPLVFVAIKGGSDPKPAVRRFDVPRVVSNGPIPVRLTIGNDGDTHFRFSGTVTMRGRSGHQEVEIPERYALPDLDRAIRTGEGGKLRLGDQRLRVGRHTVKVELRTDPGNKVLRAERVVWVVPAWLRVILALSLLAVLAGIAWVALRLRERRWMRMNDGGEGLEAGDDPFELEELEPLEPLEPLD